MPNRRQLEGQYSNYSVEGLRGGLREANRYRDHATYGQAHLIAEAVALGAICQLEVLRAELAVVQERALRVEVLEQLLGAVRKKAPSLPVLAGYVPPQHDSFEPLEVRLCEAQLGSGPKVKQGFWRQCSRQVSGDETLCFQHRKKP